MNLLTINQKYINLLYYHNVSSSEENEGILNNISFKFMFYRLEVILLNLRSCFYFFTAPYFTDYSVYTVNKSYRT